VIDNSERYEREVELSPVKHSYRFVGLCRWGPSEEQIPYPRALQNVQ
jgi:hypothetical protein